MPSMAIIPPRTSSVLVKFPTLVEWDNNLPSWQTLVAEADKARSIAEQVFGLC